MREACQEAQRSQYLSLGNPQKPVRIVLTITKNTEPSKFSSELQSDFRTKESTDDLVHARVLFGCSSPCTQAEHPVAQFYRIAWLQ